MPTLIVVRVGLGISTQDVTSYATTAFGHSGHRGARAAFALPSLNLNRSRPYGGGGDLESTACDEAESVSVVGASLVSDKAAADRERSRG